MALLVAARPRFGTGPGKRPRSNPGCLHQPYAPPAFLVCGVAVGRLPPASPERQPNADQWRTAGTAKMPAPITPLRMFAAKPSSRWCAAGRYRVGSCPESSLAPPGPIAANFSKSRQLFLQRQRRPIR